MSLLIGQFDEFFRTLYLYDPFPWQSRLAKRVNDEGWPECIDLPTASGKTACIDIAVFVLACQADRATTDRTVGRRIFFAVNRRVIVDEAYRRATELARYLLDAQDGILKEVADSLRSVNEGRSDPQTPPLDVAQLRGGIYRDKSWARSITQPMVVCTTADQLGSRLLFRGYGVSDGAKPIHAALCGCDSLVLLDEAHVTRAFSETMQLLPRYQRQHETAPPMTFVQMTATPTGNANDRFVLDDADRSDPILAKRQQASKPAELAKVDKKKSIADEIVRRAKEIDFSRHQAIGVIVNRVRAARDIEASIREYLRKQKIDADVHLVIGRMRPIDRETLQEELRSLVGPDRNREKQPLEKPVFVIATQCLEVGADYDFDVLLTECASIDALRQRFGRLNRQGRDLNAIAAIVTNDDSIKGDDPIYGDAIKHTWEWLTENDRKSVDFGIASFQSLWDGVDDETRNKMMAPAPHAAVLLPAHLDALCQTAPQPVPSPDVSYFIHGPQRDNAEVNVCWRADLGDRSADWEDIIRLLPPSSPECMTVPLREVRRWMLGEHEPDRDADVPVAEAVVEPKKHKTQSKVIHKVVAWHGTKDVAVIDSPGKLRPGDTVVIRTEEFGWEELGHIPGAPTKKSLDDLKNKVVDASVKARDEIERQRDNIDQGEYAARMARLRVIVRVHPAFDGRMGLASMNAIDIRAQLAKEELIPPEWLKSRVPTFIQHDYPGQSDETPDAECRQILVFKRLLKHDKPLELPPIEESDDDDKLSQQHKVVSLELHTSNVVKRLGGAIECIGVDEYESTMLSATELHDIGKGDSRFQALLAGITPFEAMERPTLLGKGGGQRRTIAEMKVICDRALFPKGFRHEMLSTQLAEHHFDQLVADRSVDRDLLLHLIAAHHGHARPFAPVVVDEPVQTELLSLNVSGISVDGPTRKNWTPAHRLDSGVAERFWDLTRKHGWWGLAWIEAIVRLADQQASAAEQLLADKG